MISNKNQISNEAVYLEATRMYRNYETRKDEVGRPNPLVFVSANEQEKLRLDIEIEKIKNTFVNYKACCALQCASYIICAPCFIPLCAPCSRQKMYQRANLVEQAANAHTLILRERTLLYKVIPYNDYGNFDPDFFSNRDFKLQCPCISENLTREPQRGTNRLGFDGFIASPTGADINIEQSIPLELIESIVLRKHRNNLQTSVLIINVTVPHFTPMVAVIIHYPLNGREFVDAVEKRKKEILANKYEESFEATNPQLYQDYIKYLASMKKVSFSDYQAAVAIPEAVAVELAPPVPCSMNRGNNNFFLT